MLCHRNCYGDQWTARAFIEAIDLARGGGMPIAADVSAPYNSVAVLPFVSRGGTSIAVLLTMIGVLLSVARQAAPGTSESTPARGRRSAFSPDTEFAGAA